MSDIRINVFEIAYLSDEQLNYFHSDFRIVADYFVQMQRNGDYIPGKEVIKHVEAVLQLLSVMTGDTEFKEFVNVEDGLVREGGIYSMENFLSKARAEGKVIGEAIGEIKGTIKIYHEEMNLSPQEIVDKIMSRFSLERSEAEKYVEETLGLQPA